MSKKYDQKMIDEFRSILSSSTMFPDNYNQTLINTIISNFISQYKENFIGFVCDFCKTHETNDTTTYTDTLKKIITSIAQYNEIPYSENIIEFLIRMAKPKLNHNIRKQAIIEIISFTGYEYMWHTVRDEVDKLLTGIMNDPKECNYFKNFISNHIASFKEKLSNIPYNVPKKYNVYQTILNKTNLSDQSCSIVEFNHMMSDRLYLGNEYNIDELIQYFNDQFIEMVLKKSNTDNFRKILNDLQWFCDNDPYLCNSACNWFQKYKPVISNLSIMVGKYKYSLTSHRD